MAAPEQSRHWAQINEVSFVAGMRLLFAVYRLFGRLPFRLMLYPVLCWYIAANGRARQASRAYLAQVAAYRPALRLPAGIGGVFLHFAAFGESLLDKMLLWGGLFPTASVALSGQQQISDAVAQGRGGLIICTHLGNLELCRVIGRGHADLKLTVLVHTRHAQAFNRMLAQLDPRSQLNLMQVTEMSPATAMMLADKVAQGEFVVIAGDRVPVSPNPRVAHARFMGRAAPFPVGPYVLAALLGCPVYLMFSRRTPEGAQLSFEHFRDLVELPRKQRAQRLDELAADYAARLEFHCLQSPFQWFNFYDFWADSAIDDQHVPH
ncbi:acyltransferase [Herbaspirillum robiniae]|uniref:Acyltransferase n=1 Tax=Herbaspirillum robiniae TaxID=2014887 RepID=A0A246WQS2_9BURK|nr:acyltransferase [Herbaspirillum robiniae]OWY28756.1 acyltransferase [Herbaspirillum robiniae]